MAQAQAELTPEQIAFVNSIEKQLAKAIEAQIIAILMEQQLKQQKVPLSEELNCQEVEDQQCSTELEKQCQDTLGEQCTIENVETCEEVDQEDCQLVLVEECKTVEDVLVEKVCAGPTVLADRYC